LIDMRAFNRIRAFDASGDPPTVTVESGTMLRTLVDFLGSHGLVLRSPPVYRDLSVGGAIATGSHGTGLASGGLSDDVIAMTIVTADGDVLRLDESAGALFFAAQVGLGALGAVVDVTLRCARRSSILVEDFYSPRDQVLDGLGEIVASNPFVELYWFPFSDRIFVKTMTPVEDEEIPRRTLGRAIKRAVEIGLTPMAGNALLPLVSQTVPSLARTFAKLSPFVSSFSEGARVESSLDAFHYQRAYPKCQTMSFGVPLAHASSALERLMELVEHDGRRGRFGVNMVAHARFVGESRAFLSQSHGGPICDLEVVTSLGVPHAADFYDAFTRGMYGFENARPHWGKLIVRPERIRSQYPAMGAFLEERAKIDPDRVFLNGFLEHDVFALPGRELESRGVENPVSKGHS
jgi:hypothetical protein